MSVTVCIPAYRAAGFIGQTVAAVLGQSHAELKLVVSIDPPDDGGLDGTAEALAPFAADQRLRWRQNPQRLGWAENVNALIPLIDTPFFCFLPHDDIWSPCYLETMLAALRAAPEAVIAYCDILRFGAAPPTRKSVVLPPGSGRAEPLLHFLLQGTEAQMWRGLTRSAVLPKVGGFPTDRHKGLVVECEYALALLAAGPAVHVPQTHYFKRIYAQDVVSASRERMLQPVEERRQGWAEHDRRMAALLSRALEDMAAGAAERAACGLAFEAALLRRCQQFVAARLGPDEQARAEAALAACAGLDPALAGRLSSDLALVLSAHWQATGDAARAASFARMAWETGASFASVLAHARALRRQGRPLEALERATEARRIGHLDDTGPADRLIAEIYAELGWAPGAA